MEWWKSTLHAQVYISLLCIDIVLQNVYFYPQGSMTQNKQVDKEFWLDMYWSQEVNTMARKPLFSVSQQSQRPGFSQERFSEYTGEQ